jgi:uncharacterized peroxidase-related enzyme
MSHLPSAPDATLIDGFRAVPAIARDLHLFAEGLMRGPSPFTALQREVIAVRVSRANGCAFCAASHTAAASHLGADPAMLEALVAGPADAAPDVALRPVLAYVDRLTRAPASVGRAETDAILAAGWPELALHHAALVCGFFSLMNRWVEGLGFGAGPQMTEAAGRMLAEQGYSAINRMLALPAAG